MRGTQPGHGLSSVHLMVTFPELHVCRAELSVCHGVGDIPKMALGRVPAVGEIWMIKMCALPNDIFFPLEFSILFVLPPSLI